MRGCVDKHVSSGPGIKVELWYRCSKLSVHVAVDFLSVTHWPHPTYDLLTSNLVFHLGIWFSSLDQPY